MAKLTAWVVTLLGVVLLLLAAKVVTLTDQWVMWALAIGVLVIGVSKLMRNYKGGKRR